MRNQDDHTNQMTESGSDLPFAFSSAPSCRRRRQSTCSIYDFQSPYDNPHRVAHEAACDHRILVYSFKIAKVPAPFSAQRFANLLAGEKGAKGALNGNYQIFLAGKKGAGSHAVQKPQTTFTSFHDNRSTVASAYKRLPQNTLYLGLVSISLLWLTPRKYLLATQRQSMPNMDSQQP